jgi:hypothetical protein
LDRAHPCKEFKERKEGRWYSLPLVF